MVEATAAEKQILTFWLPAEEKAALEKVAAQNERTVSAELRLLVRQRIEGSA